MSYLGNQTNDFLFARQHLKRDHRRVDTNPDLILVWPFKIFTAKWTRMHLRNLDLKWSSHEKKVKGWLAVMGLYGVFMLRLCNHVTPTLTLLLAGFQFELVAHRESVCGAESETSFGWGCRGALSEPEGSSISCSHRACGEIWCEFVRSADCTRVYVILCEWTVCVRVQVMLLGCVEFYLNLSGSSSGFRWIMSRFCAFGTTVYISVRGYRSSRAV